MRKKLTTFIVVALMGATLVGCGKNYDTDISEMQNDIAILEQRVEELEANSSTTILVEETTETKKEEGSSSETTNTVAVEESDSEVIPVISLGNEAIQVSALHNNKSYPITAQPEAERDKAINNPLNLNVPNGTRLRDISFLISGVTVKDVYVVDKDDFQVLDNITYNSVDNTYLAYYNMPGGGQYTFLITTINDAHYYISVLY